MLRMGLALTSHLGQTHVPSPSRGSTPTPLRRHPTRCPQLRLPSPTSLHLTLPRLTLHGTRPAFCLTLIIAIHPSILPSFLPPHPPLIGRDDGEENLLLALGIQKPGAVPKRSHHPTSASTQPASLYFGLFLLCHGAHLKTANTPTNLSRLLSNNTIAVAAATTTIRHPAKSQGNQATR
ncbi:hypothetical protein CTAM01_02333 [Colletotrichum tamarilloi]|uniref:Uncharacterized protein n=1 Tax=Colletotrichum tamarilloi TaxID=1209934 RepID=A0ABQ9RNP1_9PEZI|nr:uncharacterized protein CTAM01_02333 [Colletotrichum tamarilloi]KAK1508547.1 hypothetical protein CTAM01_02333 [Colletotrichum tamarilloi]